MIDDVLKDLGTAQSLLFEVIEENPREDFYLPIYCCLENSNRELFKISSSIEFFNVTNIHLHLVKNWEKHILYSRESMEDAPVYTRGAHISKIRGLWKTFTSIYSHNEENRQKINNFSRRVWDFTQREESYLMDNIHELDKEYNYLKRKKIVIPQEVHFESLKLSGDIFPLVNYKVGS